MMSRRRLSAVLVLSLLGNAFASPVVVRPKRLVGADDNELSSSEDVASVASGVSSSTPKVETSSQLSDPSVFLPSIDVKSYAESKKEYQSPQIVPLNDENGDDDNFEDMNSSPTTSGGSNLLSLLNLGSTLFGGSSGGNEDGQSDLGSLLAAVSGIVANLSGDGFDLNALIASGLGLFVGLLSEGEENPGAVISSYLLTSLDTITGGGAKNNGAFLGTFLSKLIKGTSADSSDTRSSGIMMPIVALKLDIVKAIIKFGTSVIGLASSSSNTNG